MEADFSMEKFDDFVTNFASGDLEPYIKSEPIPEKQGQVKVAVGNNFHKLVTNNKKDVLLLLYCLGPRSVNITEIRQIEFTN